MELRALYAGLDDPGHQARPRSRRRRLRRLRGGLQGQARGTRARRRRPARRSPRRCGATRRSTICIGRLELLCRARPCRQHDRSGAREILRRRAGAHHGGLDASAVLHARAQPHRRRGARSRDGRSGARPLPAVARGRPQGQALPARGPRRAAVPRKVGDGLFGLEPAVRRDDREPALQGRRQDAGDRADAQSAAGSATARSARPPRRRWRRRSRRTCARSRSITNTLAKDKEISDRWRGFADIADARHLVQPGRAARWSTRWSRPCAPPIRGCRTAITRSRRAGSARSGCRTGTATRRCRKAPTRTIAWTRGARRPCSPPMARSRRRWRRSPSGSSTSAGSTRRCGPARRRAPSRIRPCRRRILTCCSTIRASRAT